MNKKITGAVLTGIAAGVAVYLINKVVKGKKADKKNSYRRSIKPKRTYAYEYSL
jgi:xanthine/uracil/vitamin C permease (AzgA family)